MDELLSFFYATSDHVLCSPNMFVLYSPFSLWLLRVKVGCGDGIFSKCSLRMADCQRLLNHWTYWKITLLYHYYIIITYHWTISLPISLSLWSYGNWLNAAQSEFSFSVWMWFKFFNFISKESNVSPHSLLLRHHHFCNLLPFQAMWWNFQAIRIPSHWPSILIILIRNASCYYTIILPFVYLSKYSDLVK